MNLLDWTVVGVYMVGMIVLSLYLGRAQRNVRDYYLGGNTMSHWSTAISTMATQCSTNSLLGAPAFVIAVGGLLWLQYELAVPLAMIGVMAFLLPFFRKLKLISVYEYLGMRFGPGTRTLLSVLFQLLRAFSTGVTVYGISIVLRHLVGIPFWMAVMLLGIVTVVYDFFGGMKAVVFSDVIQMVVLYLGIIVCLLFAVHLVGGWAEVWNSLPTDKAHTIDFRGHGFGDGATFAFWPMLIGGLFLYMSYYGCDQTQVQRELSTRNVEDTNRSLFIGGLLRFPLVLTYCMVGVAIAAFLVKHPSFKDLLFDPSRGETNFNLAVPVFCLEYLPHGVIGLIIISLFAAAMSSLDSTINSLSVATLRDIVEPFVVRGTLSPDRQLFWSRLTTLFWGGLCILFSFFVRDISKSIIESINKISSFANGPILATFLLGILTRRANDRGTIIGILAGFAVNLCFWRFVPKVSWLWWNVIGCVVTFTIGYLLSLVLRGRGDVRIADDLVFKKDARKQFGYRRNWYAYYAILAGYFCLILVLLILLNR